MTRIVYGVSGEGSGHSSRAQVVIPHLLAAGHQVKVVSYDRGYRNLRDEFDVLEVEGLHIASVDNKVSVVRTFVDNLERLSEGVRSVRAVRRVFQEFEPDCVITDFEPMTAYLAHHHGRPLITVDNQHRMRGMEFPCPEGLRGEARMTRAIIRAMVPRPDVSLVTTFHFGEVQNDHTFLFPPLLRPEVLAATPTTGEHVLVYVTQGFESLLATLRGFPAPRFLVYGTQRQGADGCLEFRAPSRDGFLEDLTGARAVVATAGFTLLTEALHLGKPLLALPMQGQFEQQLNAFLLADMGCGAWAAAPDRSVVRDFLDRGAEFREHLAALPRNGNEALLARLDRLVADDAAEAGEFRARRKGTADPD